MNEDEVTQYLDELNIEGSDLHRKYVNWKSSKMTKLITGILYNLSTPDRCAGKLTNVPGTGNDSACAMLGYVLGRSHAVTEMMQLDSLVGQEVEDITETFNEGDING